MKNINLPFGEYVKQRREQLGKTMRGFAAEVEISPAYLCDIENDDFSGMNGTVNGRPYIIINKNIKRSLKRKKLVFLLFNQVYYFLYFFCGKY